MEPQQQIFLPTFLPLGMPAATSASPNVKAKQQGESAMQQLHERWVTPSYVEGTQHGNVAAHIPIFQDPWQHAPQSQPLLQQGLAQQHSSQLGHLSAQHERCCPGGDAVSVTPT